MDKIQSLKKAFILFCGKSTLKATVAFLSVIILIVGCETNTPVGETRLSIHSLSLFAEDQVIEVGGMSTVIHAILLDQNDDPFSEASAVRFTITLAPSINGEESPSFEYVATEDSALLTTDEFSGTNGIASVPLFSGTVPGPVKIRAVSLDNTDVFAEEYLVTIAIGGPALLVLGADEPEIEVGGQSTIVHATVLDEFGNSAGEGFGVRLVVTDHPGTFGAELPSFGYPASEDSISNIYEGVTDVDGRVDVELFSGTVFGWVKIKATLIDNENISVEERLIMIEPGPPAFVLIALGGPPESEGDSLHITLAIGIWDRYSNPAGFGIPVYLEIEPDSIVAFENIIFTDSTGSVSTTLGYTCDHSLEIIRIMASAGSVADTTAPLPLPIYHPEIYMSAVPEVIWIEPPDTLGFSDITVQLRDGNGCEISNGIVYFTALACGQLSGPLIDTTDSDGFAYSEFMIRADDIPGPPPDPPQCTCGVKASLLGYPDTESQVEIICRRSR